METKDYNIEIVHKEIDLIQTCINRMANNSFLLKGWYISLVAIILTLLFSQGQRIEIIALFLLFITIIFWGLDAFFLKIETLYRWKYDWIITERIKNNVDYLYNLNPYNKMMWVNSKDKNDCYYRFVFSKTLLPLYTIPILTSITILLYKIILL